MSTQEISSERDGYTHRDSSRGRSHSDHPCLPHSRVGRSNFGIQPARWKNFCNGCSYCWMVASGAVAHVCHFLDALLAISPHGGVRRVERVFVVLQSNHHVDSGCLPGRYVHRGIRPRKPFRAPHAEALRQSTRRFAGWILPRCLASIQYLQQHEHDHGKLILLRHSSCSLDPPHLSLRYIFRCCFLLCCPSLTRLRYVETDRAVT